MNWFKRKVVLPEAQKAVVVTEEVKQAIPELSALDYPKSKYKVYWETHLFEHPEGPWVAEVRFIGYNGFDHRINHSLSAPTKDRAQELANKLVIERMEDYKWH